MEAIDLEPYGVGEKKTRVGHVRRTREERERLLGLYEDSGLSARTFTREQGIAYSTFMSWLSARRKRANGSEGNDPNKSISSNTSFAEVALPNTFSQSSSLSRGIEVCLPSGTIIRASNAADVALVADLVRKLQEAR